MIFYKRIWYYNHAHNILRLLNILAYFPFTINEMKRNTRVVNVNPKISNIIVRVIYTHPFMVFVDFHNRLNY